MITDQDIIEAAERLRDEAPVSRLAELVDGTFDRLSPEFDPRHEATDEQWHDFWVQVDAVVRGQAAERGAQ